MILYSKKIKMKGFNNMTKLIIELPSWEVNKNDLAEIENDYEVGGALSGYKKLGNTNYFYREM